MLYAAVVMPVVRYDEPALVFVRRAAHLRRNPGQIAFPGGIIDPGDSDGRAAALREFEEELGISRERVRVFAKLEDVVTLALAVTVTPFVGFLDPPVAYAHDASETASVHEIPLAAIYAPHALYRGIESVVTPNSICEVPSWLFDYDGIHIWGATARMLHAFVTRYPSPGDILAG